MIIISDLPVDGGRIDTLWPIGTLGDTLPPVFLRLWGPPLFPLTLACLVFIAWRGLDVLVGQALACAGPQGLSGSVLRIDRASDVSVFG
jgi:hypothetical protein